MAEDVLICAPNWLGDGVIALPAIRRLRRARPEDRITLLVKPRVAGLWSLADGFDRVIEYGAGARGTFGVARELRRGRFAAAHVLPNSFRAALIPFLARIPRRRAARGHGRSLLLTEIVPPPDGPGRAHRVWSYLSILGVDADPADLAPPFLAVPAEAIDRARDDYGLDAGAEWVALAPGAARGPAKRWPAERFAAVGRRLAEETGARPVVVGTAAEAGLCAEVAAGLPGGSRDLAGRTDLPALAAVLSLARLAITNDSGAMHLAAAVGTRVVAVYGTTDPARTGPLGPGHGTIVREGAALSTQVRRDSPEAREALLSISPEEVADAALDALR